MAYAVELRKKIALTEAIEAQNVAALLDEDDCKDIGTQAQQGYLEDKESRVEWEERNAKAMKLALQVYEQKTFPWNGAANVKFPLVTVAAIQYHARAYPALISGTDIVKCRVIGQDPEGKKSERAYRVGTHMSWQNLEQDLRWEEEHDKGILVQGIVGSMFMKKVWDPICRHNITCLVHPNDFVINYYTRDLETSPRYTHVFKLSDNDIAQREKDGRYLTVEIPKQQPNPTNLTELAKDERQGVRAPPEGKTTPYDTGEQYCWLDLDGDGYAEPYIVTFDIATAQVRSIVARYLPNGVKMSTGESLAKYARVKADGKVEYEIPEEAEVYEISPVSIFTKYGFIPSPDGGFYDLGLGSLLGPLNESVNTALNQIFDAGTMATLGGGFVGRGFKGRGGPFSMRPFEWYPVDAPGDDLRKNILPLPIREPSQVLFNVLGLLINYGERIVGATDIQMGENPGQNTPAETTRTLNQNGARVYNAIYKRTWRSLRDEFRVQYDLNKLFITHDEDYEDLTGGSGALIRKDDYEGPSLDVKPAADPHIVSDTERIDRAGIVFRNSMQVPGHNRYQSTRRLYTAMQVPNIDQVLPPPMQQDPKTGQQVPAADYPPPPNPKMMDLQIKQAKVQLEAKEFEAEQRTEQINAMLDARETFARIDKMKAEVAKLLAEAKIAESDPVIKLIFASIEADQKHADRMLKFAEMIDKRMTERGDTKTGGDSVAGVEASPANAGVPQAPQGVRGNGQAGMAGGGLPLQ